VAEAQQALQDQSKLSLKSQGQLPQLGGQNQGGDSQATAVGE